MAFISIDHSQGQDIDGKAGRKLEYDGVTCGHCGALIAMLKTGNDTYHLSNCDTALATRLAPHQGQKYQAKHRCRKCRGNLCRLCARNVEATKKCAPLKAVIEAIVRARERQESFECHLKQVLGS